MDMLADLDKEEYFFTDALNDHDYMENVNRSIDLHSIGYKAPPIADILEKFELDNSKYLFSFGA